MEYYKETKQSIVTNESNKNSSHANDPTNESDLANLHLLANLCIQSIGPQENRLFYLMQLPSMLFNYFNTRDFVSMAWFINNTFMPDCQLRTSAVPDEVTGCDKVFEFFRTYAVACPNVIITHTPIQFNIRVVSMISCEQGTRSNYDVHDELFDFMKYDTSTRTPSYIQERRKYEVLRHARQPISFVGTSYVNFILNKEMTHVEKCIYTRKDYEILNSCVGFA